MTYEMIQRTYETASTGLRSSNASGPSPDAQAAGRGGATRQISQAGRTGKARGQRWREQIQQFLCCLVITSSSSLFLRTILLGGGLMK